MAACWGKALFLCLAFAASVLVEGTDTKPPCSPLLPNAAKLRSLHLHRNNDSVPLAMWRVMKSATTTLCSMAMHEYRSVRKLPAVTEGTCGGPWQELFEGTLDWKDAHDAGFSFTGLEPAVRPNWFPGAYHAFAAPYLDPESQAEMHGRVWKNFVHLIAVRHPFERAMSAFNFVHQSQYNVVGVCRKRNVTSLLECFERCLDLCMGGRSSPHYDWFPPAQANMVGSQICGNFLTQHLSHNSTLSVAMENLRRFSLIVDLASHPTLSSELLSCVLGWNHPNAPLAGTNKFPNQLQLGHLSASHLQTMHRLMRDDMFLYDEAIALMAQHHRAAMIEVDKAPR